MAFDWMQTGAPLDLATPMAKGWEMASESNYRQGELKNQALQEQDMRTKLGLDQQQMDFQKQQFQAGAQMRGVQLQLQQNELTNAMRQTQNVADDHGTLNQWTANSGAQIAAKGPSAINDLTLPDLKTPEARQEAQAWLDSQKQTLAAT